MNKIFKIKISRSSGECVAVSEASKSYGGRVSKLVVAAILAEALLLKHAHAQVPPAAPSYQGNVYAQYDDSLPSKPSYFTIWGAGATGDFAAASGLARTHTPDNASVAGVLSGAVLLSGTVAAEQVYSGGTALNSPR